MIDGSVLNTLGHTRKCKHNRNVEFSAIVVKRKVKFFAILLVFDVFKMKYKFTVIILVLTIMMTIDAAPWLNWFLGDFPTRTSYRHPKSGKDRYKQLCRVLNPDNYAFPDRIPYPAAPLCPY